MKAQLLLGSLLLAGCDDALGQWSAIVNANAQDRSHYFTTHGFKSLGMCRSAAEESIAVVSEPRKADYRCCYQCEADPAAPGRNNCPSLTK